MANPFISLSTILCQLLSLLLTILFGRRGHFSPLKHLLLVQIDVVVRDVIDNTQAFRCRLLGRRRGIIQKLFI